MSRINYVELAVTDLAAAQTFYEAVFDWQMTGYGPTYACTTNGTTDIGLQADAAEARPKPLPVIQVSDIDATLARITAAGGSIILPIFAFPGGRRFHFHDPAGNELAAAQYT